MTSIQPVLQHIDAVIAAGPFSADWESLKQLKVPQWYEDAKFGIFIHWGVYSVPAFGSEWYPRHMYDRTTREYAYHRKVWGPQDQFGYKDFIPLFHAEKFDPQAWANLFRESGAKYIVPVAEHHDGFAMYDSALSDWTSVRMGPKRDVLGELCDAFLAEGLVAGASTHRAEHWWYFDEGRKIPSDVQDAQYAGLYAPAQPHPPHHHQVDSVEQPDEAYLQDWLARTCEMVENYRPQIVYFDWWIQHQAFAPYLQKFAAFYYNLGAKWNLPVAINSKYHAFHDGTAVFDVERGQFKDIQAKLWQTDTSVSKNSWGYIDHHSYKEAKTILHDLIDIVSKNGTMLLNVGPRADGTIPEPEQQILRQIGAWLKINGEAIYASRPWQIAGEGPVEGVDGAFTDTKRAAFTSEDFRFTQKPGAVYVLGLVPPKNGQAVVKSIVPRLQGKSIKAVTLLGTSGKLDWHINDELLVINMPALLADAYAYVLKVELSE